MRRLFSIIILLALAISSVFAGDIVKVSIVYEYVSNNPNESAEQAERTAKERAKIKALEEKFGLDVSSVNSILQKNRTEGDKSSSSTDVFSLRETSVRGEWIETIKEEVLSTTYEKGFWRVKVEMVGKARNNSTPKADIRYALINNSHDRENRDQYYDGDDLFLKFSSPVDGFLCVYLIDEEENAFCLLPYMSSSAGCQHIEANQECLFFSTATDKQADEYTLNCQRSAEQNAVYIIFTPNLMTKASDRKGGNNWREEQMPRQLTYKEFISWLAKNQTRDAEMVVKTEVITIRK